MDSILYWIYEGYFSPQNRSARWKRILESRMEDAERSFAQLLQSLDEQEREQWRLALMRQLRDQLEQQPEMFALGFTLGARLMIEVLTCE